MVQESDSGGLVPDQVMRLCRRCGDEQRHYRIGDPTLEVEGFVTAEYQCLGCMRYRLIILDSKDFNEYTKDNNDNY